jgi:DNA-binding PadR family transcriptional regulator
MNMQFIVYLEKVLMALAHAIMSVLSGCPRSGYDLTKYFESSIGFFWKASHQQIYRELTKLEEQGWIEAEEVAQAGRPDKKLYQLNTVGKQQLAQWIAEPCEVVTMKDDLLIKVFAGSLVDPSVIQHELTRHQQLHLEKLATYQNIEQQYFQNPPQLLAVDLYPYLTLRRGIRHEQEWIDWCAESLELLDQIAASQTLDSLVAAQD